MAKNHNLIIMLLLDGARVDRLHKTSYLSKIEGFECFFPEMIAAAPYTLASLIQFLLDNMEVLMELMHTIK